ncbi:hypothetical protein HYE00_02260 [Mycoplasmopsis bovis]|nr:hypothetical protein HYE00_02260 [Mycoplasmopsis bovis]
MSVHYKWTKNSINVLLAFSKKWNECNKSVIWEWNYDDTNIILNYKGKLKIGNKNFKISLLQDCNQSKNFPLWSLFIIRNDGSIDNAAQVLKRYIPKGKSIDKYVGQNHKNNSRF